MQCYLWLKRGYNSSRLGKSDKTVETKQRNLNKYEKDGGRISDCDCKKIENGGRILNRILNRVFINN